MADTLRVLYVDDEPDLLELGKLFLENTGKFSVATIGSAPAALERLVNEQFDVIISDYQMPVMDGIQFLIEVRTKFGSVPFILFTGKGREEVVIKALNEGADFYLQKGGEPDAQFAELSNKIRYAVNRKRAEMEVRLSHDQLARSEAGLRIHQAELEMQAEELRGAQLALEESRDKYLDLYECAPLGYLTLTDKKLIEEVNLTAATLLGVERSRLLNAGFRKFVAEKENDQWYLYFRQLLNQPEKQVCTLMLKRNDGSTFPARLEGVRLTSSDGVITVRIAISDITDMRQKEERFKTLIEVSASGMWVTDAVGNNTYASPQWCRITGITAVDALGDGWAKGLHPDDRDRVYHDWRQAALSKETFMSDFRFIHPDGHVVWVLCQALPLKGNEGNFIEWIGTITDITERKVAEEALQKSEEEYRRLVERSSDGIWLLDKEFLTVYVNPAIEEMIGYSPEEMIGRSWYDFGDPEWVLRAKELEKRRESGIGEPHEFLFIHKDGRKVMARISTTPLYDNDGSFDGAIGVLSDITRQKQAEEEIAKREERFRGLVDTITSGVAIYEVRNDGASGKDYIIKDFNKTALEIEGKKKDEVIGKSLFDLRPAIDDYGLIPVFQQVWKTGVPEYFPQKIYIDEKYSSWYENRVFRLQSGEIVAVYDDITERKRADEALRTSEQKLNSILNNITDVVWSLSWPDMKVHYISPSTEQVYGRPVQEFIDRPSLWTEIVHPDDRHLSEKALEELQKTGSAVRECRIVRPDGSIAWIHDRSKFIVNEHGTPLRVEGIASDITDQKRADEAFASANRKLNLLSSITRHDINNQLTILRGYLTILEKRQPDPSNNEYFQKVSTAANRISAMIRFTKEYEEIGVHAPAWQDCRELVDTAAKQAPLGKILVDNGLPAGTAVFADPLVIKVFYNLMDNAVRYGGKITTIRFSVQESDDDPLIVCEDDGNGIPTAEKEKIFERGFGKNTGLGLALAREILDITGITIRETGEPGKGARFEMTVPKGMWRVMGTV